MIKDNTDYLNIEYIFNEYMNAEMNKGETIKELFKKDNSYKATFIKELCRCYEILEELIIEKVNDINRFNNHLKDLIEDEIKYNNQFYTFNQFIKTKAKLSLHTKKSINIRVSLADMKYILEKDLTRLKEQLNVVDYYIDKLQYID